MTVPQAKAAADKLLADPEADHGGRGFVLVGIAIIMVVVLVILGAYLYMMQNNQDNGTSSPSTEYLPIAFTTQDGWDLHGDIYNGTAGKPYMILVHGMNEDRKAYRTFAHELHQSGFGILSYDSRGFGDSKVKNGTIIEAIPDAEIQKGTLDVKAAVDALEQRGLTNNGVILVGASIGADVVAIYAVNDSRIIDIVLLSPGDNYHGFYPGSAISKYTGGILFVAYTGDTTAFAFCSQYYNSSTKAKVTNFFHKDGLFHGTGALTQADMRSKIEAWIISPS